MTTRSGLVGVVAGLLISVFLYLLFLPCYAALDFGDPAAAMGWLWLGVAGFIILTLAAGFIAARWSGSVEHLRCSVLGGLTGCTASMFVFSLWGAAVAGLIYWDGATPAALSLNSISFTQIELIGVLIRQSMILFLILFLSGTGIGAIGGRLAFRRQNSSQDVFNKEAPQMALNVSITAVPASIVATAIAAFVFPRLTTLPGMQNDSNDLTMVVYLPLYVSLFLVVVSHFVLMQVVPHETRQSEHLSGMDEVKMAAFVSIGAAPLLALFLLLINPGLFFSPWVSGAVILSAMMSAYSIRILVKQVLPKRQSYNKPRAVWQKTEADLFGTIAKSRGWRLVELCIGCGIAMVLPIHIVIISVLINLNVVSTQSAFMYSLENANKLFTQQAMIGMGIMLSVVIFLSLIYIFYFNLGRWYSGRNQKRKQ